VVVSTAQEADALGGVGLFIERPAPPRDPATELRSTPAAAPAPTPAPAPASAPAAPAAPSGGVTVSPAPAASAASATLIPARPTEVRGVQIERGAAATSAPGPVALARTGVDTTHLTVVAGMLLALGALLIRTARPRPRTI
jgi:2-oxoglutarate dehydrogenase E2 component (dihydrolipoamide succinyltransferase)